MAFDLSARITGDASGLVAAASQGETAIEGVGEASRRASGGARELEQATAEMAASTGKAAAGSRELAAQQTNTMRATTGAAQATNGQSAALDKAERSALATAAAEARLATANNNAERSAAAAALAALKLEQAQNRLTQSTTGATRSAAAQQFAVRNVGQQFGDFGLQVAGGASVARAFGQQAGQLGYALSEMGGKLGSVGKFLVGPWGIALTVASAVLAPFVEELFKSAEAAKQAEAGAYALGDAQSALGQIFDLTSGKLKSQNELLILNARLTAINLRATALAKGASARETFANAGAPSTLNKVAGYGALLTGNSAVGASLLSGNDQIRQLGELTRQADAMKNGAARTKRLDQILQSTQKIDFKGSGVDKTAFTQAIIDSATSRANNAIADQIDSSLNSGVLADGLKREGRTKKPKKPKKPPSTVARDEFGRDAADTIANTIAQFDGTAPVIRQVNSQIAKMNDLIDDLNRKKPPGFTKLIADAREAEKLIRTGLTKPYDDFIKSQGEELEVQRLIAAGRDNEAEALKTVQGLQRQMGPLTDEQKDSVLATVQAMQAEGRAIDDLRAKNQKYLEALGGIKGVVEDATQAFVRGDLGQLLKSPGKILDAFQTLKGRELFDGIFGNVFQELEDQVNGTSPVKDAAERMGKAVDEVTAKSAATAKSFSNLTPPIDTATSALGKFADALNGAAATAGGSPTETGTEKLSRLFGLGNGVTGPGEDGGNTPDIVVTAPKRVPSAQDFFGSAIGKIGGQIVGAFTNPETGRRIGDSLGKGAGKAIGNVATGAAVNSVLQPLAKAIGVKTSATGAKAGGFVGGYVGGAFGPVGTVLGPIVGSILGSVVGGLFKKTKSGSATLTSVDGDFSTGGNSGAAIKAASGVAKSVQGGLQSIADQLGGGLGAFNVTVGQRHGDYRVTTGTSLKKKKGAKDFDDDPEAAAAYAIQLAITQGAVTGLSAAIQQALRSSTDVNAALAEALKVKEVETLIGGLGSQLKAQFDAFDKTAGERVRIAKQYGLDVTAIEKINAEQRTKLVDDALKARVSSLSDFLENIKFGDLFEGSAADRRAALITEIAKVQAEAEAGKDGAADKLANLQSQLVSTSRDAYGTAGPEFTTDRTNAISGVERVIQMETDRVKAAAGIAADTAAALKATTSAVEAGNTLTGETNDLLAQNVMATRNLASALAGFYGAGGTGASYGSTQRSPSLPAL
jgi:hypothetical protein